MIFHAISQLLNIFCSVREWFDAYSVLLVIKLLKFPSFQLMSNDIYFAVAVARYFDIVLFSNNSIYF